MPGPGRSKLVAGRDSRSPFTPDSSPIAHPRGAQENLYPGVPGKPLILRRIEGNTLRVLPCRPSRPRTGPPDPGRLHGGAGWAEAAAICNLAHEARLFALLPKEKDPHPASPFRASVFSLRGTGIGCKQNRQGGGYGGNGGARRGQTELCPKVAARTRGPGSCDP